MGHVIAWIFFNDILHKIKQWDCNLVEVTGGEPLIQEECIDLLTTLNDNGYEVLIETGGSLPVSKIPKEINNYHELFLLQDHPALWILIVSLLPLSL